MPLFPLTVFCPGGLKCKIFTLGKVCLRTLAMGRELTPELAGLTLVIHMEQGAGDTKSQQTGLTSPERAVDWCWQRGELAGPKRCISCRVSSSAFPGGIDSAASSMGFLFRAVPAAALLCSLAAPGWKHRFSLERSKSHVRQVP